MPPPSPSVARRLPWRLGLLVLLLVVGVVLERSGLLDWRTGVALARGHAGSWWLPPVLALATAALFAVGLPGSLMTWVAGILFPPLLAVPVLVAGGVAGAAAAYALARRAGVDVGEEDDERRVIRLLARRSDFTTLLAVRLAPGFPHSAINFASGLLGLPLSRFLASTALGLGLKGTLYVVAIHEAAQASSLDGAISWRTVTPLAGLTVVLLLAPRLLRPARDRREPATLPVEETR